MSEMRLVQPGFNFGAGFLPFLDLKFRLEKHLQIAQKASELEQVINYLTTIMKSDSYSHDERHEFKKIRQRAYDRRRKSLAENPVPKLFALQNSAKQTPILEFVSTPKQELQTLTQTEGHDMNLHSVDIKPKSEMIPSLESKPDFWTGARQALEDIDGKSFVQALPGFLLLSTATVAVVGFLWLQSLELYKSSGFSQAELAAAGGVFMMIGFAAYHAVSRSKLALFLCLYAGGYETYFMISGTVQDETVEHLARIERDPELSFLAEKAEKARAAYQTHKTRYENPTSDMHNNS